MTSPQSNSRGIWATDLVIWLITGSIIFFGIIVMLFGYGEEGLRHLIRWSARISFTLFCLAFSASMIHEYFKNSQSWWLRMNRKYIGISFAIIHLIHLVFILLLQSFFHPVFNLAAKSSIIGGSIAYFFVVSMLLTSFDSFARYLNPVYWKWLHTIGGYWIWTIFLTTYLKRADTEPIHWIPVGILIAIIIFRIKKLFRNILSRNSSTISVLLAIGILVCTSCRAQNIPSLKGEILIKNGLIIDGTGAPGYIGDVLINQGRITDIITDHKIRVSADVILDATGRIISPGFIDIHAHGDPLATPEFENFLLMGVTSIALGMDGSSVTSAAMDNWMNKVSERGTGVNILPFIGHGTVRHESGIGQAASITKVEIEQMTTLLDNAFKAGCWGISMGLEYLPGYYADSAELIAIAKKAGAYDGIITSHIRNEDDDAIEQSLDEMIDLSEYCNINISHLKVVYGKGKKRAEEILKKIEKGSSSHRKITADFYPYNASYTGIGIVFPEWAKNPKKYAEIKSTRGEELLKFLKSKITKRNGPEATLFGTGPYKGKTLQDLVEEYNRPFEIILRDIIGPYGASAAYFVMDQELQEHLLLHPQVMIGSDGSPTMHHPRGYGSFAKVIEDYVVRDSLLTIEEAIYKMSGLPAEVIGLKDRGKIEEGLVADLIIFNPKKVKNKASFEQPHILADGINQIIISGQIYDKSDPSFSRLGTVLRHSYQSN